jgi:flagellar hook assembly protein FlgD
MARGNAATRLAAEAPVGTAVTARVILPSPFSSAVAGFGGGPLLVRNGKPVFRANEAFTSSWLVSRMARTAVGQRADGRMLLVAVDGGRPGYSAGMTNFELAQELVRLGAVTAMGLDSGASTTMAFDGQLLNRPSAAERPIGEALTLQYVGVQAPPPAVDVLSPNGDGVDENQELSYKLVRPSTVDAVLLGPGGTRVTLDAGSRRAGLYRFSWKGLDATGKLLPEGRWTWHVGAVDDLHRSSAADRAFSLNTTMKGLTVQPSAWRRRSPLTVGLDLDRPATVTVTVETRSGTVLRTLVHRSAGTGHFAVSWRGRLSGGRRLPAGTYVVRAVAENQVGTAELTQTLRALH